MDTNASVVISCASSQGIVAETNRVKRLHALDVRKRFNKVFTAYLRAYGIEGVFQRMNGRSVTAILDDFREFEEPEPIESGELDGIRYALYDPPNDRPS